MNKLGFFTGAIPDITVEVGRQFLFACLPVALAGLLSAFFQARVAVAGIGLAAKRPDEVGKALIMTAMVETYAVLGLLATLLLVNGIQV
jgi:V/A-type H+-transporting ATPase subunit K